MSNFIEIIPDLWLGDDKSVVKNIGTYKNLNFLFINCNKDLDFLNKSKKYNNKDLKENLEKYEIIRFYKYLVDTTKLIYYNIKNNKSVIVHSKSCVQIPPTVIAAYLIIYGKLEPQKAISIIKTKLVDVFKNNIQHIYILEKLYSDFFYKNEIHSF